MVGRTEEELTEAGVPYVVGDRALARARPRPDDGRRGRHAQAARLAEDRSLLGVHVLGTGATDLVHIGQALMGGGEGVDFLVRRSSTTRPSPRPTRSRGSTRSTG